MIEWDPWIINEAQKYTFWQRCLKNKLRPGPKLPHGFVHFTSLRRCRSSLLSLASRPTHTTERKMQHASDKGGTHRPPGRARPCITDQGNTQSVMHLLLYWGDGLYRWRLVLAEALKLHTIITKYRKYNCHYHPRQGCMIDPSVLHDVRFLGISLQRWSDVRVQLSTQFLENCKLE